MPFLKMTARPFCLGCREVSRILFIAVAYFFLSGSVCYSVVPAPVAADWNTTSTGTIGGIRFSISGLSSPFLAINSPQSFTGSNYAYAPLRNVESIDYGSSNDWSLTFASSVIDLYLYANLWRGAFTTGPDLATHYTFSRSFTIVSGLKGATVSGNTLTVPDGNPGFYDGILKFYGLVNSLSVASDGLDKSGQSMTFVATVPEPASAILLFCGGLYCLGWRKSRVFTNQL